MIPCFCWHALLSQHAVLCVGLRYATYRQDFFFSTARRANLPTFVSRIYEGLQTFCKYDDSSNVCRTSESSCDGKASQNHVSVFYPVHQRKEDEEEEGGGKRGRMGGWTLLVWRGDAGAASSPLFVTRRPDVGRPSSVRPSMIKLHPSDNNPTSPGNSLNPQFLPKRNSPFPHQVLLSRN